MGLWMKKYILGVHNLTFKGGGGVHKKTNIEAGLPKKGRGGHGQFAGLRVELSKKERVVFLRGC